MVFVCRTLIVQVSEKDMFVQILFVLVDLHLLAFIAIFALKTYSILIVLKYAILQCIALETDVV